MRRTTPTAARPNRRPLRVEALEDRSLPAGGVLYWHDLALAAGVTDHGLGYTPENGGPVKGARALAIVQAAVYDAVNSITRTHTPYRFQVPAARGASVEAAVARAAHDTLAALYPNQRATFAAALARDLAAIPPGPARLGAEVGREVAARMLAWRATDGNEVMVDYVVGTAPGRWEPDPLHPGQMALGPGAGRIVPFTMSSADAFNAPPPPALTSAEYAAAYHEVVALGGDGVTTPTVRTPEQTEIGIYWGYDGQPGLGVPPRLYNQIARTIIAQRGTDQIDAARLLALVNLAQADAGIASWLTKYEYDLWRPVTGIRRGDEDGNPATAGIPDWTPLGAPADNGNGTNFTPPFPAYTSGHAAFGAAAFRAIANFYGTDAIPFTFVSDEYNGLTVDQHGEVRPLKPRSFQTLSQAAEENARSRIYLGIHWAFDATAGVAQGNAIADAMSADFLLPVPTYRRYAVGADAGGGSRARLIDAGAGRAVLDVFAFPGFAGGVRVAAGDVTGDGVPDLVAGAGPGGGPHVKVFDGATGEVVRSFLAYDPAFRGGVWVATGDCDGDGVAEVVVGAGEGGGPHVRVFGRDGAVVREVMAYDPAFRGGARVAAGDVDGDGKADLVVGAGVGGAAHVKVFDGTTGAEARSFLAFAPDLTDGVYVAAGDCDGDGLADIIAGAGGSPRVKVFTATDGEMQSFTPLAPSVRPAAGGVRVGAADVDGDGRADLLTAAGPGNAPVVECRTAADLAQLERMFAFEPEFLGGVNV
jgi:hypothetical protein